MMLRCLKAILSVAKYINWIYSSIVLNGTASYQVLFEPRHEKTCLRESAIRGRLKPACSDIETRKSLEILDLASIGIMLFRQRTTKMLIRLRGCAG